MILDKSVPHIVENAAVRCNIQHWTAEYLSEQGGDHLCNVTRRESGLGITPGTMGKRMTYKDFFQSYYNEGWYTFTRLPVLAAPSFLQQTSIPLRYKENIIYSGMKGNGALPHKHGDAFNILVSGMKEWILFDTKLPEGQKLQKYYRQKYYLHEYPHVEYMEVDYEEKLKKFFEEELNTTLHKHKQEGNEVICLTQKTGQGVFIPRGWSHSVLNQEDCLGLIIMGNLAPH